VLKTTPESAEALRAMGDLRVGQNKWPEAADFYERALRSTPDDADALLALARVYNNLKDWPKYAETCRKLVAQQPKQTEYHIYFADGLRLTQQLQPAADEYELAKTLNLENVDQHALFSGLGETYLKLSKYVEASDAYKRASELKPDDAPTIFALGVAYCKLEDKKSAMVQHALLKTMDNKQLADALMASIRTLRN
jgi:tetratricopeptide (TPR) repeat protein